MDWLDDFLNMFFKGLNKLLDMGSSFSGSYRDIIDNMDLALAIYRAVEDGDDFVFVEVNSGVEEIEQVKREDLIGKRVTEIFPEVEEFGLLDVFRRVYKSGAPERFPISMYTDNRISGWRDNYVYRLDTGEVVAVYRDETIRKKQEEHIEYLYQILLAIRNVNQLIVTEKNRDVLLQRTCELMVETKGYNGTWIGLTDSTGTLNPVYGTGFNDSRFNEFKKMAKTTGLPFLSQVGQPGVHIVEDVSKSCVGCPLQSDDLGSNVLYASLMHDGRLYGLMMVSVPVGMIRQEELELFEEVVADISYALYGLEVEEERARVEESLRVSEAKYRSFLDESHDGVTVNVLGELVYMNPRFSEMIGYSVEELVGSSILDLHAPKYRDMIRDRTQRRSNDKDVPVQYEVELIRKDGSFLAVSYSVSRIIYEGRPSSLTFIRDITERRKLESEVAEKDMRLRGFLDSMDIGLAIWDKDLNYVEMNQTVLDRFGLSREELIGKHITEINPHVGQTDRLEAYKRVIETGESFGTEEAIIPTIDGDRHFSVRSYRVGDGVGNITRDITDRIKSERELKERIRLTQILLDNMPCVALLLRPSTREIIASNQMARDAGAVSGEHCFSTWRQRETPCTFCLASKVWAGLGEQHLVVEERSKVWDISWIPISDDLYMHYVFDITDQTRREQELKDRTYELGERIKELTCIYGIGNLTEQRDISFEDLINGALVLIPPAWQFPSETCARIIYKQDSYITSNFIETEWSQSSRILVYGEIIGQVDVYYLNEMPESDEGPFQKEEQDLINEIARKIGGFIENRNAQDELRESEKKYRNMLDSARDGVTINVLNKLVYVNPSFLDMIGYTEKELFGFSSLDLHAPEYREMVYEITRKRREGLSVPSQYEVELIRKDGSRLPVSYSVSRIKFEGEMSSLTFIRDISERKQLEREMRESEERYRTLFDSTKEGILRYDSSGVIISGNQAAADILGYENPGEMMGLDAEVLYAESGDRESIRHKLAVEGSLIDIEISMRKKDGTLGIVSSTTTLYNDPITGEEVESSIFQDITDRKKAENELEQSEERYRNLFDDSLTGIVVRDNSGMITAINRTGAAIYGYKPYELIGKHISSLWVDPSQHSDAEKNLVEQGQSSELEINVRKKNGSLGIVAADAAVRYDKAGKPVRFETFFRDITDIRSYEVRLEALHGHTASLASADTLDGVASITRVYLEQIGYNMGGIGFVEGDMLAHRYIWGAEPSSDPIRPLNGPGITVEAVNTGKTLNIGDVRDNPLFIDGFADTNIISELAVPVMVAGKAVGIINIESEVRDAFSENDQRLVEILAQHVASAFSKIKYSERLNVLHGLAFELGHAESVEDVVETTLSIVNEGLGFQYSSFQLLEDEGLVMVGADGSAGMWETLPLTGKGVTTRAAREARTVLLGDVCVDPDFIQGSTDSRSELAVPILIDDLVLGVLNVESLLLNAFDEADARLMEILAQNVGSVLTRLRAAEDKIELERQILAEQVRVEQEQELGRLKTRFISTATHELRTPVTSILGYIELIMEDPQREITDSIRNDLNVVYRNANRLVKLTNDLLDVQRITSGRFEIHREQVDIVSTLYEMLEELSPLFSEKHQMVDLISPKELLVDVDEVRIGQLFINLLRNANKFTPEQGNIRIKVEPGEGSVLISVKDTGIGLSDEEIGKLFKPFPGIRHGLNVTSTGLGLSICKGIVELHGGRIWVESDGPGEGSTFYIKLPLGT